MGEKVENSIEYFIKAHDQSSKTFKQVGISAVAMGATITGAFVIAIKRAGEFESSMTNISTLISGDSTEAMNTLSKGVLDMSKNMPKSIDDLGGALYDVLSSGVEGASDQLNVLGQSGKLAVAGLGTTKEAVDIMTSAINAFGLDAAEADKIADVMFKTVKAGKTTVAGIAQSFGMTAPIVAEAGIKLEDFQAATAALTTTGLPASQAQNSLRQAIVSLTKPTKEMSGLFNKLGVKGLPDLIDSGKNMGDIFVMLSEAAGGNAEELARAFGSVEALNAVLGIGGSVNESYLSTLEGMTTGVNRIDQAFEKQTASFTAQMQTFTNNMDRIKIQIGTEFLPVINRVVGVIGGIVDKFSIWSEAHPKLSKNIFFVIAGLGAFLLVIGGLALAITGAMFVLGTFAFLLGPGGAVALAVIGIGALLVVMAVHWDAIKEKFLIFKDVFISNSLAIMEIVSTRWNTFWQNLKNLWDSVTISLQIKWQGFLDGMVSALTTALGTVREAFSSAFSWIKNTLDGLIEGLGNIIDRVGNIFGVFGRRRSRQRTATRGRSDGGIVNESFTRVGEHGPEIISAPRGSRVHTAQQSRSLSQPNISVTINVDGSLIGVAPSDLVDMLGREIMRNLNPLLNHA